MRQHNTYFPVLTCFLVLAASATSVLAQAAETAKSEDDMLRLCRGALEERLFAGATGESVITAHDIQRQADRVTVRLTLASGEGRSLAGACIFRGDKLFDVK